MRRAPLFFAALLLASCAGVDDEHDERVGEAKDAVQDGKYDEHNRYAAVVELHLPNQGRCSGTLVGASWVISAVHCFFDSDQDTTERDFFITLGPDGHRAKHRHSRDVSGPVALRRRAPWAWADDEQIAEDIAVFRLDEPVPSHLVEPEAIPLTPRVCETGFDGRVVGYGPNMPGCERDVVGRRRYGTVRGAERIHEGDGDFFFVSDTTFYNFCDTYDGATPGDSGGPLFRETATDRLLCATNSGYAQIPIVIGFQLEQKFAALDAEETIAWFSTIRGPNGESFLDEVAKTRRASPPKGPLWDPTGCALRPLPGEGAFAAPVTMVALALLVVFVRGRLARSRRARR